MEVTGYYLACQRTSRSDSLSRNSSALYSCTLARERRDRTGFLTRLAVSSSYGSHFQKSVNCAAIGSCCQQFESCGKESSAAALGAYLHPVAKPLSVNLGATAWGAKPGMLPNRGHLRNPAHPGVPGLHLTTLEPSFPRRVEGGQKI